VQFGDKPASDQANIHFRHRHTPSVDNDNTASYDVGNFLARSIVVVPDHLNPKLLISPSRNPIIDAASINRDLKIGFRHGTGKNNRFGPPILRLT
jgi:hypothetical protein